MDLFEVKYFEPERLNSQGETGTLDGYSTHPARYHYTNCWGNRRDGIMYCCIVGAKGWFPFPDGFCPEFLGEHPAVLLKEITQDRVNEPDRFVLYTGDNNNALSSK